MFIGDDFHHNGAFRLSYGFEYAYLTEATKENSDFDFDRYDTYEWYLELGPLSNVQSKVLHGQDAPDVDRLRRRIRTTTASGSAQAMKPYLTRVTVPTLNVAGWWDQEDFYGPVTIYESSRSTTRTNRNFLVVGPWRHGGWSGGRGQKLGKIDFGIADRRVLPQNIQAPFFAY